MLHVIHLIKKIIQRFDFFIYLSTLVHNSAYVEAIKLTSYTVQGLYKYIHTLIIFTKETSIEAFIARREKKGKSETNTTF